VIYAIFGHPIDVFEFLVFLEKSRVALRQVTGALLQNNVRHRRIFLDITNQDLMQENLNSQKHVISYIFERFMPYLDIKSIFLGFLFFLEKSRVALRLVTGALLQNNVRLRLIFLDITIKI